MTVTVDTGVVVTVMVMVILDGVARYSVSTLCGW